MIFAHIGICYMLNDKNDERWPMTMSKSISKYLVELFSIKIT
ncbi:hypothetical protein HNP38_000826 [Chryseobacterium defluvii]|uniref:Uncharacterized protein n=1 Tax=Chryseobacterium defluvii TaxID=160396 RepID=A0A840KCN3_9FLAO|nr:hypothetical protein [Chryseobacterium defluvii]